LSACLIGLGSVHASAPDNFSANDLMRAAVQINLPPAAIDALLSTAAKAKAERAVVAEADYHDCMSKCGHGYRCEVSCQGD
jgi:hypothetical protein